MKMKLIMLGLGLFLLLGFGTVTGAFMVQYNVLETNRLLAENAVGVTAEYDGVKTSVDDKNSEYMVFMLSVKERATLLFPPKEPSDGVGVVAWLADGIKIHVVPNGVGDSVLFYFHNGKKSSCYSIDGFDIMRIMRLVVSPGGASVPNKVIAAAKS
ncbi:MAG: hypothetical protein FWF44_05905 [Defluviitaleaceae bacterium]|nr:hypothetical protein [Defluviitaleaceae bacterium]